MAGDHHLHIFRHRGGDGRGVGLAILGEHQTGRDQIDDVPQFGEIGGDQRIGDRNRRVRHPDMHRRQRQQRVFDSVAGQDGNRAVRRQAAGDDSASERLHFRPGLGITDPDPGAVRTTSGKEGPVRGQLRPMLQAPGQRFRPCAEGLRGRHHQAAVRAFGELRGDGVDTDRTNGIGHHARPRPCTTLAARLSRNARKRSFASLESCVMPATRLSISNPVSGSAATMRGNTCVMA